MVCVLLQAAVVAVVAVAVGAVLGEVYRFTLPPQLPLSQLPLTMRVWREEAERRVVRLAGW